FHGDVGLAADAVDPPGVEEGAVAVAGEVPLAPPGIALGGIGPDGLPVELAGKAEAVGNPGHGAVAQGAVVDDEARPAGKVVVHLVLAAHGAAAPVAHARRVDPGGLPLLARLRVERAVVAGVVAALAVHEVDHRHDEVGALVDAVLL